jgi:hypothetical protein
MDLNGLQNVQSQGQPNGEHLRGFTGESSESSWIALKSALIKELLMLSISVED